MGVLTTLNKIRAGYPGNWKKYARGAKGNRVPPFVEPTDPDDRRTAIPALGLREYWYPALPAKDVGWKKPVGLKLLGTEIVLFRDKKGEVQALWDYCPHRGVYLSWGDCFWKGLITCPYHGATYDGSGECVEFITEGPDSKMVGRLKARKYPTRTLKGIVFVWMGEEEPAPIEEDVPPEMFEGDDMLVLTTFQYWHCNWVIGLENTNDAHNCWYVHRNAIRHLFSGHTRFGGGRPRTPLGYPSRIVANRSVQTVNRGNTAEYYADEKGEIPMQMYYPRAGGYWPLHRRRLLWSWFFEYIEKRRGRTMLFDTAALPEEWRGGMHLPGMQRLPHLYTRWCVPVEEDLTRTVYFRSRRIKTKLGRAWERFTFKLIVEFLNHYNFSGQDYDAMATTRWQYPEYLSATDSFVAAERRLIALHARGLKRSVKIADVTTAEREVVEGHELLGVRREGDFGLVTQQRDGDSQETSVRPAHDVVGAASSEHTS